MRMCDNIRRDIELDGFFLDFKYLYSEVTRQFTCTGEKLYYFLEDVANE